MSDFDKELKNILRSIQKEVWDRTGYVTSEDYTEQFEDVIKDAIDNYIIGLDNVYKRDMPVPNPFASPQDYVSLWKKYQRKILWGDKQ